MARLSARDYRAILEVVRGAADTDGTDAFPEPVLAEIRHLIPCDVVNYGAYAGATRRRRAIRSSPPDRLPVPAAIARAHDQLRQTHPIRPTKATLGRPVRLSDIVDLAEWRGSPIYEAVARPLGIEYTIELWIEDRGAIIGSFGFDRQTRDFSDRDLNVLRVLAPHLVLLHRAKRAAQPVESAITQLLSPREREVLSLVADGLTTRKIAAALFIAPGTVRKHIDNLLHKLNVHNRAAAVALLYPSRQ